MLISYPFLTPSSSDDYVQAPNDLSHLGELTGAGIFPLTQGIEWHGGSHWRGPALAGQVQPVRAIADGEVVFARASDGKPTNNDALKQHPLWYSTGWTSNGVVILKHTTEIGENVGVTFYSIYQHMDTLQDVGAAGHQHALTQGDKVYRKDVIGTAGFIYGQPHHIHIEIVADRANTALLMGRDHDELRSPQGRTSCVWGDTHIVVPADVPIYEADPTAATVAFRIPTLHVTAASVEALFHTPIARLRALTKPVSGLDDPSDSDAKWFSKRNGDYQHAQHPGSEPTDEQRTIQVPLLYGAAVDTAPNSPQRTQLPARYFAKEVGRTPHDILVTLSEAHGKLTVTTRLELGGTPETVQEKGAYDLYERSLKASPGCPSAGYEMLRFGRILGPDQAAASDLHMGRLPHFRPIAFTSAQGQRVEGFIDLNAEDVNVFSDADFPHWDGWTFIADDVAVDSRARSTMLLDLIDPPSTTPAAPSATLPTPEQVRQQKQARLVRIQAALANVDTQKKLRKCVVTMATEWSTALFDKQWGWLKGLPNDARAMGQDSCVSNEVYERLKRHHTALAFWEEAKAAGLELDPVHVHFHPGEFILAFKKCGWLSESEFTQLLPTEVLNEAGHTVYIEPVTINRDRKAVIENHRTPLNKTLRKYAINSPARMAAFFGNALEETQWLGKLRENDSTRWYYPWDGRGFLQLTGPVNYLGYWIFRGRVGQIDNATRDALTRAQAQADSHRSTAQSYIGDNVSGVTPLLLGWRQDIGDNDDLVRDLVSPSDSAGYYWARMCMAQYADRGGIMERREVSAIHHPDHHHPNAPNPAVTKIYYHNDNFRDASAAVNLPTAVGHPDRPFNDYIARCIPYAQALAVLDDIYFPDASRALTLAFPEGRSPRRS